MASKEPSGPGGGLVYEAKLHLRWRPADTDYSVNDMRAANAFTLQLLKTLEEHPVERREDKPWAHEIQRLEAKLDLLLTLVTRLQHGEQAPPPEVPVRLYAAGLDWVDASPPAAGARVRLDLFVHDRGFPPLHLLAEISSVTASAEGEWVRAKFVELDDDLEDWLERFIFQGHRKSVAQQHRHH